MGNSVLETLSNKVKIGKLETNVGVVVGVVVCVLIVISVLYVKFVKPKKVN